MIHYAPLRIDWMPLDASANSMPNHADAQKAERRLARILKSWENTPYLHGQRHKGVGCDCVGATVGVLAEWMRWEVPEFKTLPPDAALHDREGAIRALLAIRRALPAHSEIKNAQRAQPGDVLITGHTNGGPGHAIIVGTERNTLWQATQSAGFVRCGWALPPEYCKLYAVLRFDDLSGAF
jgi:cell wall-associated NlpC family hydrolase